MKHRYRLFAPSLFAVSTLALASSAHGHHHEHGKDHQPALTAQASATPAAQPAPAARAPAPMAEAEVRTIHKDAGKITLKHGEIKSLDMGPMTMVFQVKDKSLLDKVKEGDKVLFTAEKIRGQFTVTSMEKK